MSISSLCFWNCSYSCATFNEISTQNKNQCKILYWYAFLQENKFCCLKRLRYPCNSYQYLKNTFKKKKKKKDSSHVYKSSFKMQSNTCVCKILYQGCFYPLLSKYQVTIKKVKLNFRIMMRNNWLKRTGCHGYQIHYLHGTSIHL